MTVAVAWVRKSGKAEQMWFVSDSRLASGRNIDYAPKITPLARKDSAISFGGFTDVAFPLMLQLGLAVEHYAPARERALDIVGLKSHALKVFDNIIARGLYSDIEGFGDDPGATFLFGGYSWGRQRFLLWEIGHNKGESKFHARPARALRFVKRAQKYTFSRDRRHLKKVHSQVAFAGDMAREAEQHLAELLTKRCSTRGDSLDLDMEPFEVVRDMLRRSNRHHTIGGAPQLVRIDQHINTRPIGVFWPDMESQVVTLFGRPTLEYENLDVWALDPDGLELYHPQFAPVDEALANLPSEPHDG